MAVVLNGNALITVAELQEILQWTSPGAGLDYETTLINFASDIIERYCNRIFNDADYTSEVYDGNGSHELYLKNAPINSVAAIHNWDTYNNVSAYEYSEHTEYMINAVEGYIYLRGGWKKGKMNFQITYNGGFATIPYDLRSACAMFAAWMRDNKDRGGMKSEKIGTYSYSLGTTVTIGGLELPAQVLSLLVNYRIINI